MAAVQETKAPATSAVASRPAEGTGGPKLLDRLRETLRARPDSRHAGRIEISMVSPEFPRVPGIPPGIPLLIRLLSRRD